VDVFEPRGGGGLRAGVLCFETATNLNPAGGAGDTADHTRAHATLGGHVEKYRTQRRGSQSRGYGPDGAQPPGGGGGGVCTVFRERGGSGGVHGSARRRTRLCLPVGSFAEMGRTGGLVTTPRSNFENLPVPLQGEHQGSTAAAWRSWTSCGIEG